MSRSPVPTFGGIGLAVSTRSIIGILFGLALLTLGVLMRPRFGKAPKDDLVSREDAPALHALVDTVTRTLDTRGIDILVVDHSYNAGWDIVDLRRRRVLWLGLPLLTALTPQERVALIAHEFAHARNGDSSRSLVVGGALRAIDEVYLSLMARSDSLAHSEFALLEWISNGMLWLLSRPLLGLRYVLSLLLLRDSHRAEYLADALAARVAGTEAEVSADEKLLLEGVFETVAWRAAREQTGVFAELRAAIQNVPDRERERLRRVARHKGARLSSTHPPTARRMELIKSRPPERGEVFLDDTGSATIDGELERLEPRLAARIADNYRASLY